MASIRIGKRWEEDPRGLLIRPFGETAGDLESLALIRNDTLRDSSAGDEFTEVDGAAIDRFYNRPGFNLERNAWLVFLKQEPVAAAVVYPRAFFHDRPPGNFDLYVVPAVRRHGLGSRLIAHVEQAARDRGHRTLETTIASEDRSSTGFLGGYGFQVVGQSAHMVLGDPIRLSPAQLPPGSKIRSLNDLQEGPDLYRETTNRLGAYDLNYSLLTPDDMARLVETGPWEPDGVLFFMDPTNRIVGIIRASGAKSGRGYLHEIRLEPSSRGSGLGRAMLEEALRYLSAAGVQSVSLDTTGENSPAHHLALKAGFRVSRHWLHFLKPLPTS